LPMVSLNDGKDSQVVDSSVYAIYPGVIPYEYQFTVENAASGSYNKVPMKYTLSIDNEVILPEDNEITESPLVVELYDLEENLLSFDNDEDGIVLAGDGTTSPLHYYNLRIKWNSDVAYNNVKYAGKTFTYKVNFVGTPIVETAKYLGYTHNKSFVVEITTAQLNFNVNMEKADIFVEGEKASLALGISNNSDVDYDTQYNVKIADNTDGSGNAIFTPTMSDTTNSNVAISSDGYDRTLNGGQDSNDNFTIDFAADLSEISRKESLNVVLALKTPYVTEIEVPVNIRSIVITADKTDLTNKDVNVTINYDGSYNEKQYSIGENNWQRVDTAETTIPVSVNGNVYARYYNSNNQLGLTQITLDNIDKDKPNDFILGSSSTSYTVSVNGSTTDAETAGLKSDYRGIRGYQYQLKNSSGTELVSWTPEQASTEYTFTGTANGNPQIIQGTKYIVSMRAVDKAGNISKEASTEIETKTVPASDTSIVSDYTPKDWTKGPVTVTFVKNDDISDDYVIKYQVGSTNDDGWEDYLDEGVSVSENTIVYARLFDITDQSSDKTASADIQKIDNVAPVISEITNSSGGNWATSITLSWTITEEQSGIEEVQYSSDGIDFSGTLPDTEWNGMTRDNERNDTLYLRVKDKAGNYSNVVSTPMKIDRTPPAKPTIGYDSVKTTSTRVTTSNGSDETSGIQGYVFRLYNSGWGLLVGDTYVWTTGSSANYTFSGLAAGTTYIGWVAAIDGAGNWSEGNAVSFTTHIHSDSCYSITYCTGTLNNYYVGDVTYTCYNCGGTYHARTEGRARAVYVPCTHYACKSCAESLRSVYGTGCRVVTGRALVCGM